MYEFTEPNKLSKLLTEKFASRFPFGLIPSSFFHVHWPKSAFPSWANLDAPHPLSIMDWAKINEIGIIEKVYEKVKTMSHAKDILKDIGWFY